MSRKKVTEEFLAKEVWWWREGASKHPIDFEKNPLDLKRGPLLPVYYLALLRRKNAELDAKVAITKNTFPQPGLGADPELDLKEMQLKVLSKIYPETIAFLQGPNPANPGEVFTAYQRETLAHTGHLVGTLDVANKSELSKTAKAIKKASRRQYTALNAADYELVAGWRVRGYDKMTPQQRFEKLKGLNLAPASVEAIRKTCERLKLPSLRKPGAPRKNTSDK
jgi:hypothetical protein